MDYMIHLNRLRPLLLVSLIGLFWSCQNAESQFQEGDLLFQDLNCGPLCEAIEAVTEGVDGKDFSHCAMVISIDDSLKVIEAIGAKVQVTSLKDFFARSADTAEVSRITLARLKPPYKNLIPMARDFAVAQVGAPYDREFILNNGSWYCSELLYEAFKSANDDQDFFKLYPMTYKDPSSEDFFPAWVDYYQELDATIPEGLPGLNPGSISRSDKLEIIPLD